jgi:hypothetical protein
MDRISRQLINKKRIEKGIKLGSPQKGELTEGVPEYRYIRNKGMVQYIKYNNIVYSHIMQQDKFTQPVSNPEDGEGQLNQVSGPPQNNWGPNIDNWMWDNRSANFSETSDTANFIPLSSQSTLESNNVFSGFNEYTWFISPFEGWVERIQFRSVVPHDGTLKYEIFKYTDGVDSATTSPTETGEFSETIDIADDIVHTTNIGSMTPASGTNYIIPNALIGIRMTTPSNPGDTNVSVLFRWKIS